MLALHNCNHITLLKATMYRSMPQELEGYEIEAHTICVIDNETVGPCLVNLEFLSCYVASRTW